MSDFEEEFEIPATSEVDPAAEFLAKEQVGDSDSFSVQSFNNVKYKAYCPCCAAEAENKSLCLYSLCISSFQAELGDIGEDLGIAPAASQPAADNDNFLTEGEVR